MEQPEFPEMNYSTMVGDESPALLAKGKLEDVATIAASPELGGTMSTQDSSVVATPTRKQKKKQMHARDSSNTVSFMSDKSPAHRVKQAAQNAGGAMEVEDIAHQMRLRFAEQVTLPKYMPDGFLEIMEPMTLYQDDDMDEEIDTIPAGCVVKLIEQQSDRKEICLVEYWILQGFINIVSDSRELRVFPQTKKPFLIDYANFPKALKLTKSESEKLSKCFSKFTITEGEVVTTLFPITVTENEPKPDELKSDKEENKLIGHLEEGSKVFVLKIGSGRNLMIRPLTMDSNPGWITALDQHGKPLLGHTTLDFNIGYTELDSELKALTDIRPTKKINYQSQPAIFEIQKGTIISLLKFGGHDANGFPRAKIEMEDERNPELGHLGWVNLIDEHGKPLFGPLVDDNTPDDTKAWLGKIMRNDVYDLELQQKKLKKQGKAHVLDIGSHINDSDCYGRTALFYAAAYGHTDAIRYLLSRPECSVRCVDMFYRNALHYAANRMICAPQARDDILYTVVCRLLVKAKAKINLQDRNGWTPLQYAILNGYDQVAKSLIQMKADVHIRNEEDKSAAMMAEEQAKKGGVLHEWLKQDDLSKSKEIIAPPPANAEQLETVKKHLKLCRTLNARVDNQLTYAHTEEAL